MRSAKWRLQPATENQKTFVQFRWNKAPKYVQGEVLNDAARSLRIQRLTKGEAANIITRIKHGAMVSVLVWRFICGGTNPTPFVESIRAQNEGHEERGTAAAEGAEEAGPRNRNCGPVDS